MMDAAIQWQVIAGIALFFIFLLIGVNVLWCFVVAGAVIFLSLGVSLLEFPRVAFHTVIKDVLMAVAYFILAGSIMSAGGLAERLVQWTHAMVGWLRGGLASVAILTSLFFGALTGSSLSSVAALGPLLVGRMQRYGYKPEYSSAVICASGFMGHLIPPSIPFLIYGLLAEQSIAALFASTILPGVLLAGAYLLINVIFCKRWMVPSTSQDAASFRDIFTVETARFTWRALPALFFPILILGGIYGGAFTPTEAAAVSCVYALVVGLFVYRELNLSKFRQVFTEAASTTGMLIILTGMGMVFSRVILRVGVAEAMTEMVLSVSSNPFVILIMINVLLLVLGMFMETICILLIVVPLLIPIFESIGMNLVHAGAMVVVNCGIGTVTPPFAAALFLGARVANVPFHRIAKPALLYILIGAIPVLLLVTYIPELSLWLPRLLVGAKIVD